MHFQVNGTQHIHSQIIFIFLLLLCVVFFFLLLWISGSFFCKRNDIHSFACTHRALCKKQELHLTKTKNTTEIAMYDIAIQAIVYQILEHIPVRIESSYFFFRVLTEFIEINTHELNTRKINISKKRIEYDHSDSCGVLMCKNSSIPIPWCVDIRSAYVLHWKHEKKTLKIVSCTVKCPNIRFN